jgi:hypothetical protein
LTSRAYTILLIAAVAITALLLSAGCRGQATTGVAASPKPSAKAQAAPSDKEASDARPAQAPGKGDQGKPGEPQVHVERVHTAAGIVTVTRAPKATAGDLGVPVFKGAHETDSALWRLQPPEGRDWVLAIGQFTSAAPIGDIERFYQKALEQPEVRRNQTTDETLVVLSRVRDLGAEKAQGKEPKKPTESESIVVRLTRAAGSKTTNIVVRRAVRGAPVKIEPSGELPGRPKPKPGGVPVKSA